MINSPLSVNSNVNLIESVSVAKMIDQWQNNYNIDISSELKGISEIHLYECCESKLRFFVPFGLTGSGQFYQQLQQFNWYYRNDKWEYDAAWQDLQFCTKILEVGCGTGYFLNRLKQRGECDIYGLELNPEAVAIGQGQGLPILLKTLGQFVDEQDHSFDAICAFQVLEHLGDIQDFLSDTLKLLRPGGKLILSVPNSQSFLRFAKEDLLNMPPHHLTQWNQKALSYLCELFPLKVIQITPEPLAKYHVDLYLSTFLARFKQYPRLIYSPLFRLTHQVIKPLLKKSDFLRKQIVGHTLYACFEKINQQ
ncbi:MAG: class I SAM-dependent methyltransferase [Spirulina sp. DLM2.Bin59]|nr:MAG: class I SAM-dependent methyltransferase [Spirulina sp. DLM2.Bin59]